MLYVAVEKRRKGRGVYVVIYISKNTKKVSLRRKI